MDGLGVANWQIEDDFNIWINPGQLSNYKNNVYGELGFYHASSQTDNISGLTNSISSPNQDGIATGSQWGGMNMDVSYGEWGVYIGRPYTGAFNSSGQSIGASPLGLPSFNLSGPLGMMNQQATISGGAFGGSGTAPGNNRVDLFYGLHSAQPMGLYLSYADQYNKSTLTGVSTKDEATEWNLGAGGIFGGGVIDASLDLTFPSSKCGNGAASCLGSTYKSDAGPSFALLGRHHANMGNSKLLSTAQILYIDASTKDSASSNKIDETTMGWRIDTALNSKPIPDALVVVGIGLAGANTEAKLNNGGGKVTVDQLAIPVNVAIEHQTLKSLKTRFGLSKPLYNSSNCKDTTGTAVCPVTPTGGGGFDKQNTVSDGAATASFGIGWAVMDNLNIDAVINQDILFSGTYMISGVAETLSSKLSATYRFK
jgi:hypothetical protein